MSNVPAVAVTSTDLNEAKHSVEDWTETADRLAREGDWWSLSDGLERIRALRAQLSVLERHVEDHVASLMPRKLVIEDGLGMERKTSTNRRDWQRDALVDHLWNSSFADANGVLDAVGQSERFLAAIKECFRVEPRVTPLRERGVSPDEFCEETPGRTTVRVWRESGDE